ncbi:hypothetical protein LEL_06714 [Akanthomyces lecanii RCEF 1005]|uniref:F-box domain-containing protein n=1 Tax=Akanthomyces lecanii RCEF 1005 TaxID=1081108 RepID=A0A168GX39_CORDF|nr:hypothetical protein LEL_06714 [Akanthomyces lecanii RCEF 1005]
MIIDLLDKDDLLNVSTTCRLCHDELAPIVFRIISFCNEKQVCESALHAAQKYGHFTRRLEFDYRPTGKSVEVSGSRPLREPAPTLDHGIYSVSVSCLRSPVLLPAARDLLRRLHMPDLQAVEVLFKFTPVDVQ